MQPLVLGALLAASTLAGGQDAPASEAPLESVPELFDSLAALEGAVLATASVSGLTLTRDAGTLVLERGSLALLEVRGRVVGALFAGAGRFRLDGRSMQERAQLVRLYGSGSPQLPIDGAFLLFTDDTEAHLSGLSFSPQSSNRTQDRLLEEGLAYLIDAEGPSYDAAVAAALVNDDRNKLFHAHFDVRGGDRHFYRVDGSAEEGVSFGRERDGRGDHYEVVAGFSLGDRSTGAASARDAKTAVSVMQVQIEVTFDDRTRIEGASTASMTTNVPGGWWVPFNLHSDLELEALSWGDGAEAEYTRGHESSQIWVRLPSAAAEGSFLQLSSAYHGEVGEWRHPWYYLRTTTGWYPSTPGTSASFDITLHTPEDLPAISIGERVEHSVEDGIETSRWVQSRPFDYASLNIGRFKVWEYEHALVPPVRVHMNEEAHIRFPLRAQQRNPQAFVADDIAKSLAFFQSNMGELTQEELTITEIPARHGQAFPGMIHLSFLTFGMSKEESVNQVFRAHEVAHQWWGITVRPHSYRDWWLAEGMSQFSALWYLEVLQGDNEDALEELLRYRDRIRDRRHEAAPTGLGRRVLVGGDDEDYQIMVYEKGAWIGHMIRHLLMDYETGDESLFRTFLTDVMTRYHDRRMSTREFQAVLEEYVGADMAWFFDQWVLGTAIPEYRLAHRVEVVGSGQYRLQVRVRQEDVPEDFKMIVPLRIDFGEGRVRVVRMMIGGAETVQEMLLPSEPIGITLNAFEAVLALVSEESW
jgi:hypothetical protein